MKMVKIKHKIPNLDSKDSKDGNLQTNKEDEKEKKVRDFINVNHLEKVGSDNSNKKEENN